MPWKECNIVEERLRFIARLLDGEKMAGLCREFGIARKTGYKIYSRYKNFGIDGLSDRSRRPYRHANKLPMQIEKLAVNLKKECPHWGAIKIRERLRTRYPDLQCPAVSTVHAVLDRHGLVKRKKQRHNKAQGTALGYVTGIHLEKNGGQGRNRTTDTRIFSIQLRSSIGFSIDLYALIEFRMWPIPPALMF
jgi:putative transposase